MDSKAEHPAVVHNEVHGTPKKQGRVKKHCMKFWWCDCLVLIIVILVIILPIIFVAIPKKAQHEINASTLEVTSQEVTDPTEEGIHLKLESVIRSGSSYHPTVDAFNAALSLEGQDPFLHIDIPEAKSEAETRISVDQAVKFASLDAFSAYTKTVLGSDKFNVYLNGKTKVHLKGLPGMKVNYNKVVEMKGLNKLSGLNITDIKILIGTAKLPDGSNMLAKVSIPNPSVMTLDLGNVTMNLAIDALEVGYAFLPNVLLKPGNNTVDMQAHVDALAVYEQVTKSYKNAIVPLSVTGNSSVKDGVHLTYYEEAIKSNLVKLDLNVGPALEEALGIKLNTTST